MDVATAERGAGGVLRGARSRLAFAAVAVMVAAIGALLMAQQAADAQLINIQAIVCPILQSIKTAFSDSPFFGFVEPILNALLSLFGCTPSP
jgi:hypothetical protein